MNAEHTGKALTLNAEHIPLLIGLTGGIGAGKSYIAEGLREKGYQVYDCDREAKRIIETDGAVREQIKTLLGNEAYIEEGQGTKNEGRYNTRFVAEQVFRNPALLQQLNDIVHPAVRADIEAFAIRRSASAFIFIESAILFESGFDTLCDAVVCVTAPKEVRIKRAMQRDNATQEQIERRIANQSQEPRAKSQEPILIVQNDGEQSTYALLVQIEAFLLTIQ